MKIFFQYKGQIVTLPINPEEFTIENQSDGDTTEVLGLGEVNIIKTPKLRPLTIDSFFPPENQEQNINFFEKVIKDERPLKVVFKEMGLNLLMSIQTFNHTMKAGQERNRYFTLELLEWRDYTPKKMGEEKQSTSEMEGEGSTPIEEQKKEVAPQKESKEDDVVKFNGGPHYKSSQADSPTGKPRTAGNAKITLTNKGAKHPYHLIGIKGGSDVYGWVDEGSFTR